MNLHLVDTNEAVAAALGDAFRAFPWLIVAPTMLTPEPVGTENCYRAMRAVLRIAAAHEEVGRSVFCPGLATGTGRVPPAEAGRAMAEAYGDWKKGSGIDT